MLTPTSDCGSTNACTTKDDFRTIGPAPIIFTPEELVQKGIPNASELDRKRIRQCNISFLEAKSINDRRSKDSIVEDGINKDIFMPNFRSNHDVCYEPKRSLPWRPSRRSNSPILDTIASFETFSTASLQIQSREKRIR